MFSPVENDCLKIVEEASEDVSNDFEIRRREKEALLNENETVVISHGVDEHVENIGVKGINEVDEIIGAPSDCGDVEPNVASKSEVVSEDSPSHDARIHATSSELSEMTICQVKDALANLKLVVEDVSCELVKLLQERQTLQEEADVRNIAIEQLLKVYEKFGWKLNEPIAIQMSVSPQSPEKVIDCT